MELAEKRLAEPLPRRWAHVQGVAATARRLAPILGADADLVEAAGWLHDIGYAPGIADTGFHALDGARFLRDIENALPSLCSLVAYHTAAIYEALERGLESQLCAEFMPAPQELTDALTYCDVTTGPDGRTLDVQDRIADIFDRYGADHPVSRALRKAQACYVHSVRNIEARLTT